MQSVHGVVRAFLFVWSSIYTPRHDEIGVYHSDPKYKKLSDINIKTEQSLYLSSEWSFFRGGVGMPLLICVATPISLLYRPNLSMTRMSNRAQGALAQPRTGSTGLHLYRVR